MKQFTEKLILSGIALIFFIVMWQYFLFEETLALLMLTMVLGALLAGIILFVPRIIKKPLSSPKRISMWCIASLQILVHKGNVD